MKTNSILKSALCAAGLFAFALTGSVQAQIVWGSATTISSDTDVATAGTLLYGYYIGGDATDTVNGVTFTSVGTAAAAGFTSSGQLDAANYNAYGIPPADGTDGYTGSANYTSLLSSLIYTDSTNQAFSLTLTGLTAGHTYEFQEFDQDGRGGYAAYQTTATDGNSVTLDANPNNTSGSGVGEYAIGTFVATGSTETISFTDNLTGQVNAYQVRDEGVVSVPEPSTVALIGLGALGLVFLAVRRRHSLI